MFGGTPFAYQLDRQGNPAQPSAAYAKLDNGARIVVVGEGMASLFLGVPDGGASHDSARKSVSGGERIRSFLWKRS